LLPPPDARRVAAAHAGCLADLGYVCDPDPALDGPTADARWLELVRADLADDLHRLGALRRAPHQARPALAGAEAARGGFRGGWAGGRPRRPAAARPGAALPADRPGRPPHPPHRRLTGAAWTRRSSCPRSPASCS